MMELGIIIIIIVIIINNNNKNNFTPLPGYIYISELKKSFL